MCGVFGLTGWSFHLNPLNKDFILNEDRFSTPLINSIGDHPLSTHKWLSTLGLNYLKSVSFKQGDNVFVQDVNTALGRRQRAAVPGYLHDVFESLVDTMYQETAEFYRNLSLTPVKNRRVNSDAHWRLSPAEIVNLNLLPVNMSKLDISTASFQARVQLGNDSFISTLTNRDSFCIFSDGSVKEQKGGYAFRILDPNGYNYQEIQRAY